MRTWISSAAAAAVLCLLGAGVFASSLRGGGEVATIIPHDLTIGVDATGAVVTIEKVAGTPVTIDARSAISTSNGLLVNFTTATDNLAGIFCDLAESGTASGNACIAAVQTVAVALGAGENRLGVFASTKGHASDSATSNSYAVLAGSPGSAGPGREIAYGVNTGFDYAVSAASGRVRFTSAAATVTSCGTNAAVTGGAVTGLITIGTGTITACTLNFNLTYATTPACQVTGSDAAVRYAATPSTTTIAISSSAAMDSNTVSYWCSETQ